MFTLRPYQAEEDFWTMREFLSRVFMLNGGLARSWHVARLDYARWHTILNCAGLQMEDVAILWEEAGQLAAFLMPDGGAGEAHLCVHPELRTAELEEEMLAIVEEHLAEVQPGGYRKLVVWSPQVDELRQALLQSRSYKLESWPECQWRRSLLDPLPLVTIPHGYDLHPLGDGLELLERCYASGLAFHQGDIQVALDNRRNPSWYHNIQNAPLYRRDLDLVATTPAGEAAAFCTIWFDDATRSAYFEPVGTVPAHQRRGLGRALLVDGLSRLQRMGATQALICGYSPQANALYQSVMGDEHELYEPWVKEWE